ncbi:hypothetical protein DB31_1474 [Hyalangium minutum]|uniref:Uncharacterized protein n=1 Tax=Hyalangium minutum TaxID=394096 RepID=A0A085WCE5_9BACT|nr:hypothetical protein DB31_1474 [Hyalangium minutum]
MHQGTLSPFAHCAARGGRRLSLGILQWMKVREWAQWAGERPGKGNVARHSVPGSVRRALPSRAGSFGHAQREGQGA